MNTAVVNIKSGEPWDVYIGRSCLRARDQRCRVGSWAENPYKVHNPGQGGLFKVGRTVRKYQNGGRVGLTSPGDPFLCGTVEEALEKYERRLRAMLAGKDGDVFRARLLALKGKRLGCWCAPDPCHGHVLVKLIDELEREQHTAHSTQHTRGGA